MGENVERRFDDLAKSLANRGHTRKGALKVGVGALGAAVAAALPGRARADQPQGNDACAHFCNDVFPPGPARGECKSAAAHGAGICIECGPGSPVQPPLKVLCVDLCCNIGEVCCNNHCVSPICSTNHVFNPTTCRCECPPGLPTECNGTCVNTTLDTHNCGTCGHTCPTGAACINGQCTCPTGTEVCNNACVPTCPDGQHHNPTTCVCECPAGQTVCQNTCCRPGEVCTPGGTCECVGGNACSNNADCACGTCIGGICSFAGCQGAGTCNNFLQCGGPTGQDCQCYTTAEGAGVCGCNTACAGIQACTSTVDCPTGSICTVNTCCGAAGVCVRICNAATCAPLGPTLAAPGAADAGSGLMTAG